MHRSKLLIRGGKWARAGSFLAIATLVMVLGGCPSPENGPPENGSYGVNAQAKNAGGDSHAHGDELFWQREDVNMGEYQVWLGHHGIHLHAGEPFEPAVRVRRGTDEVADAEVFVSLFDLDGNKELAPEKKTVFEPETAEEPAHYAQAELKTPAGADTVKLRFRIQFPDGTQETADVNIPLESH